MMQTNEVARILGIPEATERLEEALTHRSYVNEHPGSRDYEQLELLGDAVLGLCVAELLIKEVPAASVGRLTRMRAALVSTEALSGFARNMALGEQVRFGKGATVAGDAQQSKVLADVVESIVGAVYLHHGLDAARSLTERIVGDGLQECLDERDPKSKLQELVQAGGGPGPRYDLVGASGPDHARVFEVTVSVDEVVCGRGVGRSKKLAERAAAEEALQKRESVEVT